MLSSVEIEEMCGITQEMHSLSRVNTSICWQQSRLLWLQEDDVNSKKLHTVLSSPQRRNYIVSFVEDGNIVEGVQPIRTAIFSQLSNHFKGQPNYQ